MFAWFSCLQALKSDCVKTLIQRCDLLCVDLLQSEEEQGAVTSRANSCDGTSECYQMPVPTDDIFSDPSITYETPQRVFAVLPESQLCVSDYIFADESAKDSRDRFRDLLDISVEPSDVIMDVESKPGAIDCLVLHCRLCHDHSSRYCGSQWSWI